MSDTSNEIIVTVLTVFGIFFTSLITNIIVNDSWQDYLIKQGHAEYRMDDASIGNTSFELIKHNCPNCEE